jgi:tRNA threonylcarbamoyladenosine biosynthesis protein TsaB
MMHPLALSLDLALETSRRETSLALGHGAEIRVDEGGARHASDLLPRLAGLLAQAGLTRAPYPLSRLFVGLGPGSYTGLRIGIAMAHGLARATGAALYGISSFEALAFSALVPGEEGVVLADARAGRVYWARYHRTESELEVLVPPQTCEPEELPRHGHGADVVFGHPGLCEALGLEWPVPARYREDARPRAAAVLALGRLRMARGALDAATALEPLYLAEFARRDSPRSA